jgi:hypothetical protein
VLTRQGRFTASRISDLLADGTGKSRMNYIFDIASDLVGSKVNITTKAMEHGIMNENTACKILISEKGGVYNSDGQGGQIFYPINEYLGATPDVIGEDFAGDSKCQYEIYNFIQQNEKIPKKYYAQMQCQMMALKVEKGYLINYLTKPEEWGNDEWAEYPFELSERYHIHEIVKDEEMQYNILVKAEKYYPDVLLCVEMLLNATEMDEIEFFYQQLKGKKKYLLLKDTNWITNTREVIKFNNKFYIQK